MHVHAVIFPFAYVVLTVAILLAVPVSVFGQNDKTFLVSVEEEEDSSSGLVSLTLT